MIDSIFKDFNITPKEGLPNTAPTADLESLNEGQAQVSTSKYLQDYSQYDEGISYADITSPGGLARRRHEEQPWYSSLGAAGVQAVTTLIGQTMEGTGYLLDGEQWLNIMQGTEKEWSNWFSDIGKSIQETGREIAPIYTDPEKEGQVALGDWTYWMSNAPSIVSSLSFFIPGMGVSKALGAIGKVMGLAGKFGAKAGWAAQGIIGGTTMRAMESAMEAGQVHQEMNQLAGKPLTKEQAVRISNEYGISPVEAIDETTGQTYYTLTPEGANEIASKAAAGTFNANMALAISDIPQFLLATAPFGKVTEKMTAKLAKTLKQGAMPVIGSNFLAGLGSAALEGAEEGYQYIAAEGNRISSYGISR